MLLSHLVSAEDTLKLKELFRVLCKRLHPDLNPTQTEDEKDLFTKVKAAYELNKIHELQNILLYLDETNNDKKQLFSTDEKIARVEHLENNIKSLQCKISQLHEAFPFNVKELIFDEKYIVEKQEELRNDIEKFDEQIAKYLDIINLMADE